MAAYSVRGTIVGDVENADRKSVKREIALESRPLELQIAPAGKRDIEGVRRGVDTSQIRLRIPSAYPLLLPPG